MIEKIKLETEKKYAMKKGTHIKKKGSSHISRSKADLTYNASIKSENREKSRFNQEDLHSYNQMPFNWKPS